MNLNRSAVIIAFVATALIFAMSVTVRPLPALAAASATVTTGGGKSTTQQAFTATMTGSEEVPPKNTKATGTATFMSNTDGSSVSYKIRVASIKGVTMAHIHSGGIGKNGPVVVTLFKSASPTGTMNGLLSQGTVTSTNLEGPLKGKTISDLIRLMNDGAAYANVHTQQNPKGEIRGQISASASASASTSGGSSASASASAGY
ncbi:MAG TPA: CHRD domain-containing protein [Nitrososphaeraceae archaeon]|nr:CHRD domain-containing protein [Nitrososphaeraceae archaeon]